MTLSPISPPKPDPHSPGFPSLYFLLGVLTESLPLTKQVNCQLNVLSEHGYPLMPGGQKFLFPPKKKKKEFYSRTLNSEHFAY